MENQITTQCRLERMSSPSVQNWQIPPDPIMNKMDADVSIDMGWGKLIFGHTFKNNEDLAQTIISEKEGMRDICLYLRDPHVLLSHAPDKLFLDPSHTYRLWAHIYYYKGIPSKSLSIRRIQTIDDIHEMNRIYEMQGMVPCSPKFVLEQNTNRLRSYFLAYTKKEQKIVGSVIGVDHVKAFNDPENGASLWCLAVDPQANIPGIGETLVRHLVAHYFTKGRNYVDLSVMYDNAEAIKLYEKMAFQRIPVFCVKRKNVINQSLYIPGCNEPGLNPYATIIVEEAQKRGITVDVIDKENSYFNLSLGGRSILCRESLSELTSAVAMSQCDDKKVTHRVLHEAGLNVPRQIAVADLSQAQKALEELKRVVIKPARGEQGNGISVDVSDPDLMHAAFQRARKYCEKVLFEEYIEGEDVRIVVINYKVVAGAIRRPPMIQGTGSHTIQQLIEKYNRRRLAATCGESSVPLDEETERCLLQNGCHLGTILTAGKTICIRKTANLHTGGTIHDVTDDLHPALKKAAEKAAIALKIPVTGLDLIVPHYQKEAYVIIEANERPGLANHEPQPTAERFIDLLFPQTASMNAV